MHICPVAELRRSKRISGTGAHQLTHGEPEASNSRLFSGLENNSREFGEMTKSTIIMLLSFIEGRQMVFCGLKSWSSHNSLWQHFVAFASPAFSLGHLVVASFDLDLVSFRFDFFYIIANLVQLPMSLQDLDFGSLSLSLSLIQLQTCATTTQQAVGIARSQFPLCFISFCRLFYFPLFYQPAC